MKTSRVDKLALELEAEERHLRQRLLQILPDAAESGSNPFTSSEFNPSNLNPHHFHEDAESLLTSARACVQLRESIGLDSTGSVGALFLAAWEENGSTNEQRRGPRKLAAALLKPVRDAT
jgi:hypothetical protein